MERHLKAAPEPGSSDWFEALDWKCHICQRTRPDNKISVATHWHVYPSGMKIGANVRYCNDNSECRAKAMLNDFTDLKLKIVTESLQLAWDDTRRVERHIPWLFFAGLALGLLVPFAYLGAHL